MSELISRSMAKAEIMDWTRVITNPKMLATVDTMHILDTMEGATDEEFKAEAKRRGYNLIKIPEKVKKVKLQPCVCGRKQITCFVTVAPGQSMDFEFYKCDKCGLTANLSATNHQARLNWNAMIEEKMKDGKAD